MAKRTLAERLDQVSQRKLRAAQDEARLKVMQRKQRNRSLTEIGELAARAGLDHLPASALFACFKRISEEANDPERVALWEREGDGLLKTSGSALSVIVARFPEHPKTPLAGELRRLGFRWNRILNQWEGRVPVEEATTLVTKAGGTVAQVGQAA